MTAILLGAAIEAARKLGGDASPCLLFQITELGGKVIFGTVIIVAGIFLARILSNLVGSSTGESSYAQTIVKYAIIALFTAIGLTFMGALADQIVMMAFGLILGSAAVATAIAFRPGRARLRRRAVLERMGPTGKCAALRGARLRHGSKADGRRGRQASRRWCDRSPRRAVKMEVAASLSDLPPTNPVRLRKAFLFPPEGTPVIPLDEKDSDGNQPDTSKPHYTYLYPFTPLTERIEMVIPDLWDPVETTANL